MTALTLHNLPVNRGAKKKKERIGRGNASGHGTYATRGLKGQRARSGGRSGLKLKGLKANLQNLPKLGGFKSARAKLEVVNLKDLEKNFKDGEVIRPSLLWSKGLIKTTSNGVKLLGAGKFEKKLTVHVQKASQSAIKSISEAGGKIFFSPVVVKITQKKKEDRDNVKK